MSDPSTPNSPDTAAASSINPPVARQRWWQTVLVYPALVITLITAVPTWIEKVGAWQKGVAANELAVAEERNRLVDKNLSCMTAPYEWVTTDANALVDATICHATGDILVRMSWQGKQIFDLVSIDRIRVEAESRDKKQTSIGISAAVAATRPSDIVVAQAETVICQRWLGDGQLLQRVQTPRGCFDQVLNTYQGKVVSRKPASCDRSC